MSSTPYASPDPNLLKQEILKDSTEILDRLISFRIPYDARRNELYRHFVSRPHISYYPDGKTRRASTFVPYPYSNVLQIRASIMEAFFSIDPPFETLPGGSKDEDAAFKMQKVLEKLVLRDANLRGAFHEFLGNLLVYGFAGLKVEWDWDSDPIAVPATVEETGPDGPVINQATGEPNLIQEMQIQKKPRSRPRFIAIDIYDLLVDPDGAFVAMVFDKTMPQLRRENEMSPGLYDEDTLDKLDLHLRTRGGDPDHLVIHMAELWDAVNGTYTLLTFPEDIAAQTYKDSRYGHRAGGQFRSGGSFMGFRRTTAEAPPLLLAHDINPFLHGKVPILFSHYTKLPGEVFGMGVIEPIYALVESYNKFLNMITDRHNLSINQRLLVDRMRHMDYEALQVNNVPGGIIPVEGPPDKIIKTLDLEPPGQNDYAILPLLKGIIEVTAGQSDFYAKGVGSPTGNRTATGIQSVIQQSNKRLIEVVAQLENDIFRPLLAMVASMIQQNITDDFEIRITDEMPGIPKINSQFIPVTQMDLAGSFDFRITGSAYMENKFVQQRNALDLYTLLQSSPYFKQYEAQMELMRVFRMPNPGRFLMTPEEALMQRRRQQELLNQMPVIPGVGGMPKPQGGGQSGGSSPVRKFAQTMGQNSQMGQ